MKRFSKLSLAVLSSLSLTLFSAPVFAEHGSPSSGSGSGGTPTAPTTTRHSGDATVAPETESHSSTTEVHKSSTTDQAKEKLAEEKTKACENRKNTVTNVEKRVANRGQARLDAITKVATKVENYVQTNKLSVANYDSLVATVNAKKTAAQNAVNAVKTDPAEVSGVTCQNGDGKTKVEGFKKDMKAQQDALKAYRQAVKNLITAVKAAKTTSGEAQQ